MASRSAGIVDVIAADIVSRQTPVRWFDRVAPEHAGKLEEIREAWVAGKFGTKRRSAARAISRWLADNGIATIGEQGVDQWLAGLQ